MQNIKIFIASPGDVIPERHIAERVMDRLNRRFSHYAKIVPVMWDREPLVVTSTYQELIIKPSECDIVITILWSRLGTNLNDHYRGEVSQKFPVTGTEWEFEEAYAGYLNNSKPKILLYRKMSDQQISLSTDTKTLQEALHQKKLLEDFTSHWLIDEHQGTFKGAFWEFNDVETFETLLEEHLSRAISQQLDDGFRKKISYYDGNPFRGLESFELQHQGIFFGRGKAVNELREAFQKQLIEKRALMLILGASGSGKSSLLKAGLLPDLLLPGMVDDSAEIRYASIRPGDFENDIYQGLISAITQPTALPELRDNPIKLLSTVESIISSIQNCCETIASVKGFGSKQKVKLLLMIDQLEELFTFKSIDDQQRKLFDTFLEFLARSGYVWIIATLRSDFFSNITKLPNLLKLSEGEGRYLLTFPNEAEIGQMIVRPAEEAGVSYEIDPITGVGLDEVLRTSAVNNPASLPLLEYMLEQLWLKRSKNLLLTYDAYNEIGTLEGALGTKAEALYLKLPEPVQQELPAVIHMLVSINSQNNNLRTARKVKYHLFEKEPKKKSLVDAFLAPSNRLFVSYTDEKGDAYIRVAHEALFSHWARVKELISIEQKDIELRDRLEAVAFLWIQADEKDKGTLLLSEGLPLVEAVELYKRRHKELPDDVALYVRTSYKKELKRQRWKKVFVSIAVATVTLIVFLVFGFIRQQQLAQNAKSETLTYLEALSDLKENYKSASFYYKIAKAEAAADEKGSAVAAYKIAISLEPKNSEYYIAISELLIQMNRYSEALVFLKQVIALYEEAEDSDKMYAIYLLLRAHGKLDPYNLIHNIYPKFKAIVDAMRESHRYEWLYYQSMLAMADAHETIGEYAKTVDYFSIALDGFKAKKYKNEERASALSIMYSKLAWYQILAQRYEGALASAKKSVQHNHSDLSFKINLAHSYLLAGNYEEAKKIYLKHKGSLVKLELDDEKIVNKLWENIIFEDFEQFKNNGIESEKYGEILELLR